MTNPQRSVKIYTVVEVVRGIAVDARSFTRLGEARRYASRAAQGRDLQEDDVRIFADTVTGRPKSASHAGV